MHFLIDANLPRAAILACQKFGHQVEFARDIAHSKQLCKLCFDINTVSVILLNKIRAPKIQAPLRRQPRSFLALGSVNNSHTNFGNRF